jgi:hypothetical protein
LRPVASTLAQLALGLAGLLTLVGLLSLPAGGLMFALPFVFFLPRRLSSLWYAAPVGGEPAHREGEEATRDPVYTNRRKNNDA